MFSFMIISYITCCSWQQCSVGSWSTRVNFAGTKSGKSRDISEVQLSFHDLKGYLQVFTLLQINNHSLEPVTVLCTYIHTADVTASHVHTSKMIIIIG